MPQPQWLDATALSVRETRTGVDVLCAVVSRHGVSTAMVHAKRAISAMPLFVAKHVVASLRSEAYDPVTDASPVVP